MSRSNKKAYTGSKRFDSSCRSHGTCPWCQSGRQHKHKRREPADIEEQLEDLENLEYDK